MAYLLYKSQTDFVNSFHSHLLTDAANVGRCELYKGVPKHDHMPVIISKPGLSTAAPDRRSFCFIP